MLLLLVLHIENWLFKFWNRVHSPSFLSVHFCIASLALWLVLSLLLLELLSWLNLFRLGLGVLLILEACGESRLWKSVSFAWLLAAILVNTSHAFELQVRLWHFSLFRVRRTVTITTDARPPWTWALVDVNWGSWNHIWIILFCYFNYNYLFNYLIN